MWVWTEFGLWMHGVVRAGRRGRSMSMHQRGCTCLLLQRRILYINGPRNYTRLPLNLRAGFAPWRKSRPEEEEVQNLTVHGFIRFE